MKYFILFVVFAITLSMCHGQSCTSDSDCTTNKCCLSYGIVSRCTQQEETLGASCGGKFKCPSCSPPFKCVLREKSFTNFFRIGNGNCYLDR